MTRKVRRTGRRRYSRLERVNEALREVLAEELELIEDERLEMVTVTGVDVAPDLRHATVWFSALATSRAVEEVARALTSHRVRLQSAIGRQLRLKRTPELSFEGDPAIATGSRVEEILRKLHEGEGSQ